MMSDDSINQRTDTTIKRVRGIMSDDDKAKVVKCLVDFIDKVTKKEQPSKAEVEVLPEVVRALREFNTL